MEHLLILWDSSFFHFFSKCLLSTYYMPGTIVGDKAVKRNILCPGFAYTLQRKQSDAYYIAAKSLQSCPTLCNPIDGSPPGSPVPGILQARTLEWGAIAFSVTYIIVKIKGKETIAYL